jgi:hypothetical protein
MFERIGKRNYNEIEPIKAPVSKEHYRVGCTDDGNTTLTVMGDNINITLTMNHDACKVLIRMLEATLTEDIEEDV